MRIPTDEPLIFSPQTEGKCKLPVFSLWKGLVRQTVQCPVHSIESVVVADSLYSVP